MRLRLKLVSSRATMRLHLETMCAELDIEIDAERAGILLWDVPVLDPSWPRDLKAFARNYRVAAILSLADRRSVRIAQESGAAACLDSMIDALDLVDVLRKLENSSRADAAKSL